MAGVVIYTDAQIRLWQPRARHYCHQYGNDFVGREFIAWIDAQARHYAEQRGLSRADVVMHHQDFTDWLAATCVCGGKR